MYRVTITRSAEKDLRNLDRQTKNRIVREILSLVEDPRPHGCRKYIALTIVRKRRDQTGGHYDFRRLRPETETLYTGVQLRL
jgi:mRNA-degrading endonuclease RelE of RelBE toxin-antitoxin system